MNLKSALLGTAVSIAMVGSAVGSAEAAHFKRWYVGLEGGVNWVDDFDADVVARTAGGAVLGSDTYFFHPETGWAVFATLGYDWGRWRLEGEVGYRHNDLEMTTPGTPSDPGLATDGELSELTLMANVLYDIPLSEKLALSLGVGAGADHAHLEVALLDDKSWSFAYQGIAGLSWKMSSRLDLILNYRYLRVMDPEFSETLGGVTATLSIDDFTKHSVTLGLRYDLHADEEPPPPPPPVIPLPPPKAFIIFFGYNKCNITGEADAVLSEAAATAKSMGSASVRIVGHTDSSGSSAYNQKLSECRANATRSNLVGKGVSEGSISTMGKGESELMVQTGDGVKEPQNRRATVDLN